MREQKEPLWGSISDHNMVRSVKVSQECVSGFYGETCCHLDELVSQQIPGYFRPRSACITASVAGTETPCGCSTGESDEQDSRTVEQLKSETKQGWTKIATLKKTATTSFLRRFP